RYQGSVYVIYRTNWIACHQVPHFDFACGQTAALSVGGHSHASDPFFMGSETSNVTPRLEFVHPRKWRIRSRDYMTTVRRQRDRPNSTERSFDGTQATS